MHSKRFAKAIQFVKDIGRFEEKVTERAEILEREEALGMEGA